MELWVVVSVDQTTPRCVLRASNECVITKSTFFAGQIRTRSTLEIKASFKKWNEKASALGHFVQPVPDLKETELKQLEHEMP